MLTKIHRRAQLRRLEDSYAIVVGSILIVLGLVLLNAAGLVTGGTAGIALIVSHLLPVPVGVLFTVINLPFFLFAHRVMGGAFTVKTIIASVLIAGLSAIARLALVIRHVDPIFASLVGGTVIGMGSLALLRHRTGVGGIGVIAVWLERRMGYKIGAITLAFDVVILGCSVPLVGSAGLLCSMLSAAAMSAITLTWHRVERLT